MKISPWLFYTPRILSILFLMFLVVFSFDVFDNAAEVGFWGTILGLLIHNIPVIVLAFVLWISWRREIIAGVVFILAGLLYLLQIIISALGNPLNWSKFPYSFIIAGPALLIGILFLINWFRRKKGEGMGKK